MVTEITTPTTRTWRHLLTRSGAWVTATGTWALHPVTTAVDMPDVFAWVDSGGDNVVRQEFVGGWSNAATPPSGPSAAAPAASPSTGGATVGVKL